MSFGSVYLTRYRVWVGGINYQVINYLGDNMGMCPTWKLVVRASFVQCNVVYD